MAHPLQPGDVAPDLSDYNFSTEADRRPPVENSVKNVGSNYHGQYPASDQSRAEGGRLWKVGQATPNFSAPFDVIQMDGDNNGTPADIHEIDIYKYGDSYDPSAPMRVRTASWGMDTDFDGKKN